MPSIPPYEIAAMKRRHILPITDIETDVANWQSKVNDLARKHEAALTRVASLKESKKPLLLANFDDDESSRKEVLKINSELMICVQAAEDLAEAGRQAAAQLHEAQQKLA